MLVRFILIALIFFSCSSKKNEAAIITVKFDNTSLDGSDDSIGVFKDDSVKRDIPEFHLKNTSLNRTLRIEKKKVENAIGIGSLENGISGEQIRIDGNDDEEFKNAWGRVLIFTKKDTWKGEVFFIRYAAKDALIRIIDSLQYQKYDIGNPKSGWGKFIGKLTALGIYTIPDYHQIPGYGNTIHTEEVDYNVEIGSLRYYRMYSYPTPRERIDKFDEAKRFMQIIKFVKKEFSFPEPHE